MESSSSRSSSSSSSTSTNKTYDYVILLVVALCSYLLATIGTQHLSSSSTSALDDGILTTTTTTISLGPRTDKATGLAFSEKEVFASIAKQPMTLLGVGTRKKAILNIYSVGVYGSNPIVKQWTKRASSQSQSKNKEVASTAKGPERCQSLLVDSKHPKAVKLTFAMGIGPEKIAEAVSGLKDVKESVRTEFHGMILRGIGGKLLKGESMAFAWKGDDVITVAARGITIGTMKDKALAQGVLGLYIGPRSVSPSLLEDLNCR